MRPKRKNSSNVLADAAYDLGTLTPAGAVLSTAGRAFNKHVKSKSKKNPAKFDGCVKAVKKRGGAVNAYAVCKAATSRGNKGKIEQFYLRNNTGFQTNPEDAAAETYEYFHGRPPSVDTDFEETIHYHKVLAGVGKLISLEILAINGNRKVLLSNFKGALLAMNERKKNQPKAPCQLYIVGGDQSVNLKDFGITEPHELEILGALIRVVYFTRKDHLRPEDGGIANYKHKFGDKSRTYNFGKNGSRFPLVGYDVRNKLLSIQGGSYDLPAEGIDG